MIDALAKAKALLADQGYDADSLRTAPTGNGIAPCIPSKVNSKVPIPRTQRFTASTTGSRRCSANSRLKVQPHLLSAPVDHGDCELKAVNF